ncbi:hypothetical protein P3T25_008547 [Paraburkholderia sp. GAS32]
MVQRRIAALPGTACPSPSGKSVQRRVYGDAYLISGSAFSRYLPADRRWQISSEHLQSFFPDRSRRFRIAAMMRCRHFE